MQRVQLGLEFDDEFPEAALPFLDVAINGEICSALLDTGAATSSVTARTGLAIRRVPASGTGVFGIARAEQWRADVHVAIGNLDVGTVDVEVLPPDHPGHGHLVGQDILGRWCCEYRLGSREVILDAPRLTTGDPITVGRRGHIVIPVEWVPGVRARALFDTGASLSVVDAAFAAAHPALFQPGKSVGGIDADGNTAETQTLRMARPTLLGSTFPESLAVAVDLQPIQQPGEGFDMILGWPVVRHGRFTIDVANKLARHHP